MAEGADRRPGAVVLIVDDDAAMRLLLRESLEQDGLTVVEAADGVQALEVFARERPDLVLMDVQMPELDGYGACAGLRRLPGGEEAAIVMATGLEDIASIERAYEAGATDFITKPINWPILSHRVRYLLRATAAFRALRRSQARLSHAQRVARLGNWEWDIATGEICWSDEVSRIFGLETPAASSTYAAFLQVVHPEDRPAVNAAVQDALQGLRPYDLDHRIVLPDGTERVVHEQAEVLRDEGGGPARMHGTVQDITERKRTEAQIRRLAYYDALTGLPNRELFKEHAGRVLEEARRHGATVALIYIDLDRFKRINDTLSHTIGDEVLKQIAGQLAEGLRASDVVATAGASPAAMLSRLGGDEFMVLLSGLRHGDDAARVAERILACLAAPVTVRGHEFLVTASIGIAVYPADGDDVDALMKNADAALYHTKDAGRNAFRYYAEHMNARTLERLGMEAMLKKALEQEQLVLHYQPQVHIQTGRIVALEALVRWMHPEMGMVAPGRFIPLAEETGLILPLGEWVLDTACAQAQAWCQAGLAPRRVAVNLSSHQFRQAGLARMVTRILERAALDPRFLELELTESALMSDVEEAIATLCELKGIGLRLSVDDFGTGYSSLNYLKRFPIDTLKIDQSFTRELTTSPSDASITKVIIALAHSLNLATIAEGVETEQQLAFLRAHGCDEVQGYLIGRPLPAADLAPLLRAAGWSPPSDGAGREPRAIDGA